MPFAWLIVQNYDAARSGFSQAQTLAPWLFEPFYNGGDLLYYQQCAQTCTYCVYAFVSGMTFILCGLVWNHMCRQALPKVLAKSLLNTCFPCSCVMCEFASIALLAYRTGDLQESFTQCKKALECFPEHADSKELMVTLQAQFSAL